MYDSTKTQVLKRLAIAEGHLKKVKQMVSEGTYCPDIIHQSQAVQAALKKVDELVLQGHLNTCVINDIKGPAQKREKLIDEVVTLFRKNA